MNVYCLTKQIHRKGVLVAIEGQWPEVVAMANKVGNAIDKRPLNGTKTHPLTEASRRALGTISMAPIPRQEVNPGVADRLEREGLVIVVDLPSPYKGRKGKVPHLKITEAGFARATE